MDLFSLKGKKCFITGVGGGIGQEIAIGIAEAGADAACLDLKDNKSMEQTLEGIRRHKCKAIKLIADVTNSTHMRESLKKTIEEFSTIDIAINCADIINICPAEDMEEENWDQIINVNLKGIFLSCQIEAKQMLPQGNCTGANILVDGGYAC